MSERRLFRWIGSKARLAPALAPRIAAHLARTGGRLVSLFYGSGAIEQATGIPTRRQLAADACADLRAVYAALDWGAYDLMLSVQQLDRIAGRSKAGYLRVRAMEPQHDQERAARFLYLQSLSFNGIWRVSARGEHNVSCDPARLRSRDPFPPLAAYEETRRLTRGLELLRDWTEAADQVQPGDLVLSDSPYGAFDGYTAGGFSARDHRLLALRLKELHKTGASVIAFNAPGAETLYRWARVERLQRPGNVSCDTDKRDAVDELLITAGLEERTNSRRSCA